MSEQDEVKEKENKNVNCALKGEKKRTVSVSSHLKGF